MAANRPRLYVTPQADTLAAIDRIAFYRGVPRATVAAEYLDLIAPSLEQLGEALAEAHSAQEEAGEAIHSQILHVHGPILETCWKSTSAFRGIVDRQSAPTPPSSNTGVTPLNGSPARARRKG